MEAAKIENEKNTSAHPKSHRDWIGISLSTICGVHCIITPFLVFLLPSIHDFFENEWIHRGFFVAVVGVVAWTMQHHFRIHRSKRVLSLFGFGMLSLVIGLIAHDAFHMERVESILSILGGVLLIWGHFLNHRLSHCHEGHCQAEHHCDEEKHD